MRRTFFSLALLFFCAIYTNIVSQDRGFGAGIMFGEPTGLSAKYWLDDKRALDFGLAYSFLSTNNSMAIHCDYVFHNLDLIDSEIRIPVYYGFGARLRVGGTNKNTLSARGVIGVLYHFPKESIDVFFEVAPAFNLFPKTVMNIDSAIGARYFFR